MGKTLLLVMGNGGFAMYAQELLDRYIDVMVMLYGEDFPIASGDHEWGGIIPAKRLDQHRIIRGTGTHFPKVFGGLAKDERAQDVENIIMLSAFTNCGERLDKGTEAWLTERRLLVVTHSDDSNEADYQKTLPDWYVNSDKFKIITGEQLWWHLTFKKMGVE